MPQRFVQAACGIRGGSLLKRLWTVRIAVFALPFAFSVQSLAQQEDATAITGAQLVESQDGEMVAAAIPSDGDRTWEFSFHCFADGRWRMAVINLAEGIQPIPENGAAVEVSISAPGGGLGMRISRSTWYWSNDGRVVWQGEGESDGALFGRSYETERVLMHMLNFDRMAVVIGDLPDMEFDMTAARPILTELKSRCEAFD